MIAKVRVEQIKVGDRRRDEMGDIAGLAKSIEKHGLLHPVVIDADHNLVAGERRLRAHEHLGRAWIEARQLGDLTDAELREIELEENLRRKDLTPYELSKTMVERLEVAREIAKTRTDSVQVPKPARGPSPSPTSERAIEDRTGIPATTAREAQRHVETADAYPVFQKPDWKQYHVLEAREALSKLPEEERPKAVAIIDEPGIPPREALTMLKNITVREEPQRKEIYSLHKSDDIRDRNNVATTLAEMPPMPDPRMVVLYAVVRDLDKCIRVLPDDALAPRLRELRREINSIADGLSARKESA